MKKIVKNLLESNQDNLGKNRGNKAQVVSRIFSLSPNQAFAISNLAEILRPTILKEINGKRRHDHIDFQNAFYTYLDILTISLLLNPQKSLAEIPKQINKAKDAGVQAMGRLSRQKFFEFSRRLNPSRFEEISNIAIKSARDKKSISPQFIGAFKSEYHRQRTRELELFVHLNQEMIWIRRLEQPTPKGMHHDQIAKLLRPSAKTAKEQSNKVHILNAK